MKKEDLIQSCRYYKGEKENPYNGDKGMFWACEQSYVEMSAAQDDALVACFNEYNAHGLTKFEEKDGVPLLLKALLYNRYQHWAEGTPSGFKKMYKERYRG